MRNRVRLTQPPAPILPPPAAPTPAAPASAPPSPHVPEPFSPKSPGQHEELLGRVKDGFHVVLDVLDRIAKQKQDIRVVVELDSSIQREILEVVKEIREDVKKIGEGLSKAEEDALARQLHDSSSVLEEAVVTNQPKGKKKKTK